MKQNEMFGNAIWVCAGEYSGKNIRIPDESRLPYFPVLRRTFELGKADKAILRVVGLGFFHCYINGKEITDNAFLPLATDYEERQDYPQDEKLTSHRIYVPEFDVTDYLKTGKNVLSLHFGGGWYSHNCDDAFYGFAKAIYLLRVFSNGKTEEFFSSENDKISDSFVKTYWFTECEYQDFRGWDDSVFSLGYDDSSWENACPAKPVNTEYLFSDCPADITAEILRPVILGRKGNSTYYDIGKNCSAIPVLELNGNEGDEVTVIFSESRNKDGSPDKEFVLGQELHIISDGKKRTAEPQFTWFSFRYFEVKGNAEVKEVKFIHSDVKIKAEFHCDNGTLNWLYRTYLNTQLSNMHGGIPSDCPHLERRGYTGDGQLTCHAAMTALDARKFYKKWIWDISDCQDIYSGHVQYTAPYNRCGGGPGGWGCAIVEVPYQYYKHYGDTSLIEALYPQMLRYFQYLDKHSISNMVASDKPGQWCLGDWCGLGGVMLPDAYVNNYFYIKSLGRMIEIAKVTGRKNHIPFIKKKSDELKLTTKAAYYNKFTGSFCGGLQGADAFAVDMGIGDKTTYKNLVKRYEELGYYDTGIFGTDILTRILFEHGNADLAIKLMTNDSRYSFEEMRREGATSLWENWPHDIDSRSRNHPMFGAVTAYLFDYISGIRQPENEAGYKKITISPAVQNMLSEINTSVVLPAGKVSFRYQKNNFSETFIITIPENIEADFIYKTTHKRLCKGENVIKIS